ncbi:MAG: TonB family protein [Reyranella sp.]|nr:TonB family protein [Reyranella sp.]MDP3161661.1 TonB family protein [Reyranella sp.]
MVQTVSALTSKSSQMSPVALVLALVLHGLAAAGLWWASPLRPTEPPQDAIMITVDAGAPPASTEQQGDDKPVQPVAAGVPEPAPPDEPREEARQALAEPQPPRPEPPPQPTPPPSLEQALASPEELPPPTARDFPKPAPPPPPPRPAARPPQGAPSQVPLPRPAQPMPPPPPANSAATAPAPPSNSSDWLIGKGRARNAYLDQIARLTSRYRFYPRIAADNKQEGRVVTRVTIARDGRLIDVKIDKSSGWPAIDAAELETIRKSAPFPPVPRDMPGDPLILILPINYDLTFSRAR